MLSALCLHGLFSDIARLRFGVEDALLSFCGVASEAFGLKGPSSRMIMLFLKLLNVRGKNLSFFLGSCSLWCCVGAVVMMVGGGGGSCDTTGSVSL